MIKNDFSEWELQVQFVTAALDHLEESMDNNETQVALVTFDSNVNLFTNYSYSKKEVSDTIKYHTKISEGTYLNFGLKKTIDILENDPNTRYGDRSVKKLVVILTDGESVPFDTEAAILDQVGSIFCTIFPSFFSLQERTRSLQLKYISYKQIA